MLKEIKNKKNNVKSFFTFQSKIFIPKCKKEVGLDLINQVFQNKITYQFYNLISLSIKNGS